MTTAQMTEAPAEKPRPWGHKDYDRNKDRVRSPKEPCAYCGRAVPGAAPYPHTVIVINGGSDFGTDKDDENAPGHMGGFPVGPDCAKRLRKAGVAVY